MAVAGYPRSLAKDDELKELIREGARLTSEIAALRDQIKMRANRIDELSARVRELVPDGGKEWLDEGMASVKFGVKQSFDEEKFLVDYPPEEHPYFYKHKPAVTTIVTLLPEDESSKYRSEEVKLSFVGGPKLSFAGRPTTTTTTTTTNKEN